MLRSRILRTTLDVFVIRKPLAAKGSDDDDASRPGGKAKGNQSALTSSIGTFCPPSGVPSVIKGLEGKWSE